MSIIFIEGFDYYANHPFIAFMTAAAGAQFRIGLNTSGQVFIQLGTSTILATSALGEPVFEADVWYYLEVEAFVHDTTGFVRVYRDGVLLVEAANQDTRGQAGSDLVEMIRFIGNNGGGTGDGPNIWSIDDIYVLDDSTRLGQCRVSTLLPHQPNLRGARSFFVAFRGAKGAHDWLLAGLRSLR